MKNMKAIVDVHGLPGVQTVTQSIYDAASRLDRVWAQCPSSDRDVVADAYDAVSVYLYYEMSYDVEFHGIIHAAVKFALDHYALPLWVMDIREEPAAARLFAGYEHDIVERLDAASAILEARVQARQAKTQDSHL